MSVVKPLLLMVLGIAVLSPMAHGQVTLSCSLQPYETYKATFGRMPGVAVVACTVRNDSTAIYDRPYDVVDYILQEHGVTVVARPLVAPTVTRGDKRQPWYRITQVLTWVAWGGTGYMVIRNATLPDDQMGSKIVKILGPVLSVALPFIQRQFEAQIQPSALTTQAAGLLNPRIHVAPGESTVELRLVGYQSGLKPFSTRMDAPAVLGVQRRMPMIEIPNEY